MACMVNGVRSKKSRFPATLFQPLCILDADFYYRQNRDVQRLKEATCPFHYHTIPFSYTRSAIALFLSEVLFLSLREEESNPVLFSFLFNALQLFDTQVEGSAYFHHWFMLHLTRQLGFFPSGQWLDPTLVLSEDFRAFSSLSPGASDALMRIAGNAQGPPDLSDVSHPDRNELLESLIRYYSNHIDGFSRLRSYAVLKEVFS
jgi:DNA repair protein RecO (recombination protein O)